MFDLPSNDEEFELFDDIDFDIYFDDNISVITDAYDELAYESSSEDSDDETVVFDNTHNYHKYAYDDISIC